jgi:hypothetical protein
MADWTHSDWQFAADATSPDPWMPQRSILLFHAVSLALHALIAFPVFAPSRLAIKACCRSRPSVLAWGHCLSPSYFTPLFFSFRLTVLPMSLIRFWWLELLWACSWRIFLSSGVVCVGLAIILACLEVFWRLVYVYQPIRKASDLSMELPWEIVIFGAFSTTFLAPFILNHSHPNFHIQ